MDYPACPSAFDSSTPAGRIVHRVCLAQDKPTHHLAVSARACRLCQSPLKDTHFPRPGTVDATTPPEIPNLARRTLSYAEALVVWTAAGCPKRSDKEVERIFHQHCKRCGWFAADRQICRGCGCPVADSGYAVRNKIKMATENCPRDFW